MNPLISRLNLPSSFGSHRSHAPSRPGLWLGPVAGALLLGGCAARELPELPSPAPPPPAPQQQAQQFAALPHREPEQPQLAPLPGPARKVLVFVREMANGREAAEDPGAEAVIVDVLLSGRIVVPPDPSRPPIPRLEILNRTALSRGLDRDLKAMLTRREELGAEVLKNLAAAGAEIIALGEVAVASADPTVVGREVRDTTHLVQANVSLVRVDDAVTLGSGTASARRPIATEAKRESLEAATAEALRELYEYRDVPATQIQLTVEGLRSESEAARVEKSLQGTRGVLWVKDVRFQLGPEGTPSSVARFDVGWGGKPDELKQILRDWDLGFRLEATRLEGNRWSFRAAAPKAVEETK